MRISWTSWSTNLKGRKKMLRGSVPTTSSLEESQHASFDFDDRPIRTIVAAIEKKKATEKGRMTRPSKVVEEDVVEDCIHCLNLLKKKKFTNL